MKYWAKGGLIGFLVAFIGLWAMLFLIGHDPNGWKCVSLSGPAICTFFSFLTSYIHWIFVLFFSWVGFFGGVIDSRIIRKILKKSRYDKRLYLKITSTVMLTLIIVFSLIALLIFDDWPEIIVYTAIFVIFIIALSWLVGRIKYGRH